MSALAIEQLFIGFFGRPANAVELNFWQGQVEASHGIDDLRAALAASADFRAVAEQGNDYLVGWAYNNLFGRAPFAAETSHWSQMLASGSLTQAGLVEALASSAVLWDADVLRDKTAAAQAFSAALDVREHLIVVDLAPSGLDGKTYLAAVKDAASVDAALDQLYETVTADGRVVQFPPGEHLRAQVGAGLVQEMYIGFFGRPADRAGLGYWESLLDSGSGPAPIRDAFEHSAEFQAVAAKDHASVVDWVYQNDFGHAPDQAGRAWWTDALDQGNVTVAGLVEALAAGALGSDAEALNARVIAAEAFTAMLALRGDIMTVAPQQQPDGHAYLALVTDTASLNGAFDNVYEVATDVIAVPTVGLTAVPHVI